MKGSPKVGTTGEQRFVVEPCHAIDFAEGGNAGRPFHNGGDVAQSLDDAAIFETEREPAVVDDEGELEITDNGQPVVSAGEPGLNGVKAAFGIATLAIAGPSW